jgi:glycosyltransferase involved in cell wall biosynthesis
MSRLPAVSVVIAAYNRAEFLPATVDSILSQRFRDFEVIVVDDGSTDETKAVLAPYAERVRYLYQNNRGPSAARNLGVRNARADWIAFQDSDDLSLPGHLETLHEYVKNHPQCAMVFANGGYVGGAEHDRTTIIPRAKSRRLMERGVTLADLFEKSIFRLQAALVSRRCYHQIGGHDESLRISMDLDLAFRMFSRYPIAYIDQVVFSYRRHSANISANEELRLLENIRVIEKLLNDNDQAAAVLGRRRVRSRLAYRYYRLARGRWRRGDKARACDALREAIRLRPLLPKYRLYQIRWARTNVNGNGKTPARVSR